MSTARKLIRAAANATGDVGLIRRVYRVLAARELLPLRFVWPMAIDREFHVVVDSIVAFTYEADKADVVGRHLFWGNLNRWEAETWREFVPLARRARGFLDIGAFTGAYSLVAAAANPSIDVIAFEPVPAVYQRLVRNVELNGFGDRITPLNVAVSTQEGTGRFYLPHRDLPDTGYLDISTRASPEAGAWIDVRTTTVAAALPDGFHVDLVKIDVEDAEGPVVSAMRSVLADHRPTIVIEFLSSGSHSAAVDVLESLDYEFFHLRREGRARVSRPAPVEGDSRMNFLCVPR